jgi:hypothetical protein
MGHPLQSRHEPIRVRGGGPRVVGAVLHQQQPLPIGKEVEVRRSLPPQRVDHHAFEALETNRSGLEDFDHVVSRAERIRVAEAHQRSMPGTGHQRG